MCVRTALVLAFLLCASARATAADQEFRLKKPDAQSVAVLGEFNGWKAQPMTRSSDGTWTLKTALPPGTHGYKFLVNGSEWILDPGVSQRKTVEGVENSAVTVGAETSAAATATPRSSATPVLSPAMPASSASPPSATALRAGEVTTLDVPLSATQRADTTKEGNPSVSSARVAIGVPANFEAARTWPILVISATNLASNIELLGAYQSAALEEGWVVLAADGAEKPKSDHNEWRLAMIGAGLDYMEAQWPSSKSWPVACGGFSGGAKRSGFMAAALAKSGRKVIGMLMGGVNQDIASEGLHTYRPPASQFRQVPIFLSSGTNDTIATPQQHERVAQSMKGSGFRRVKIESFPGAHDVYPQHTTTALQWFMAESTGSAAATPTPKSALDGFFKKP